MGEFSIWHWFIVLVLLIVYIAPAVAILHQAGYSRWWVLTLLVPIVNVIAIWVFAFRRWPALRSR